MGESIVRTSTTISIDEKQRKLSNVIILSTCEAIIEMGGFDNFFENLNLTVLSEYNDTMFPNIRRYIAEKEELKKYVKKDG